MLFLYNPYSVTVRRGHRRLAIDVTELLFHIMESHVPFSQDQRARNGYKLNAFLSLFAGKILEVIERNNWKNMLKIPILYRKMILTMSLAFNSLLSYLLCFYMKKKKVMVEYVYKRTIHNEDRFKALHGK